MCHKVRFRHFTGKFQLAYRADFALLLQLTFLLLVLMAENMLSKVVVGVNDLAALGAWTLRLTGGIDKPTATAAITIND